MSLCHVVAYHASVIGRRQIDLSVYCMRLLRNLVTYFLQLSGFAYGVRMDGMFYEEEKEENSVH